jgi:hypothetical protein
VIFYSRKQLIELLEIDEGFLHTLEREEILVQDGPEPGSAEFSDRMLERVRVARTLMRDLEVNLEGTAVIVRMREETAGLHRELAALRARLNALEGK